MRPFGPVKSVSEEEREKSEHQSRNLTQVSDFPSVKEKEKERMRPVGPARRVNEDSNGEYALPSANVSGFTFFVQTTQEARNPVWVSLGPF